MEQQIKETSGGALLCCINPLLIFIKKSRSFAVGLLSICLEQCLWSLPVRIVFRSACCRRPSVANDVLPTDRRTFVKNAGKIVGGRIVAGFPGIISAQTVTNAIKVGLVGCGGRGTGAASQALHADDYTELSAVADITQTQVDHCLQTLKTIDKVSNRVKVEQPNQFLGLNAYQK